METYDYLIEEDVNLDDYEFETMSVISTREEKPEPDPFRFSTKTVNVRLYPVINFKKRIEYLRETILCKYEDLHLSDDELKDIILSRIIRDGLSYEQFFEILSLRSKSNKISDLIPTIIKQKNSKMIDINKIYENTEFSEELFHFAGLYKARPRFDLNIMEKLKIPLPKSVLRGKDGFRNQATVRFFAQDKMRIINAMIFKNGKLTLSGIRNSKDLIYSINIIIEHIKELKAMNYKDLYVHNIDYQSVNTHFDLNFALDNRRLKTIFQDTLEFSSTLVKSIKVEPDPKSKSGLKVRFICSPIMDPELEECQKVLNHGKKTYFIKKSPVGVRKGSSVTFFQTGKVNIYGSSSTPEVEEIYRIINYLMDKHYKEITTN